MSSQKVVVSLTGIDVQSETSHLLYSLYKRNSSDLVRNTTPGQSRLQRNTISQVSRNVTPRKSHQQTCVYIGLEQSDLLPLTTDTQHSFRLIRQLESHLMTLQ